MGTTYFARRVVCAFALIGGLASAGPGVAGSVTATVFGGADPFLAGQPAGAACCGGDTAPGQSPTLVGAALTPGAYLTFSGSGGFNFVGGPLATSLDGENDGASPTYIFDMTADYGTGVSGPLGVNVDGLVGVFLSGATPSGAAPAQLDYGALGLGAASYAPGLNQIFWIGDGLTGLGTGAVQTFLVPIGATRLYLGTVDGSGWYDNIGSASVTVSGVDAGAAPEPSTWAMGLIGLGGVALLAQRRRRTARALAV